MKKSYHPKKILYIGSSISSEKITGRENLSRSILRVLEQSGVDLRRCKILRLEEQPVYRYILSLIGMVDGLTPKKIVEICKEIEVEQINSVLIDGSNFGLLTRAIKKNHPSCNVITFFHNCETKFFFDAATKKKTLRSIFVLLANYIAERSACRFSDKLLCLTEIDSQQLEKYYGRCADFVFPIFMNADAQATCLKRPVQNPYCLFVGGAFYANVEAAEWLSSVLAYDLPIDVVIVGQGMEDYKPSRENQNVHVIGGVDSLAPFYHHAEFVIAPIFSGSGMKTKVAEALKFGKLVIGTPKAFVGYDNLESELGVVALTKDEYIEFCKAFIAGEIVGNPILAKDVFSMRYSEASAVIRMKEILRDSEDRSHF